MHVAALVASLLLLLPCVAQGDERRVERTLGADRFAAGGTLQLGGDTTGDLVVAGGDVEVEGRAGGDALLAGGNLSVRAAIAQDLYAAGGRIRLNGTVGRNARIAGGSVELGPQARVAGNLTAAGGEVTIRGTVDGYLQVGAGEVLIDGTVRGDVEVGAGEVELGPNARVLGRLRYASTEEIERDPAAQVGAIERIEVRAARRSAQTAEAAAHGMAWVWTAGLLVLAALFAGVLPAMSAGIAQSVRTRFGWSLFAGFVALVCIPVAALLAAVTVIGIPLALAAVAAYLALLLLGYVAAGVSAGALAIGPARAARLGWRVGAAVLGMLALSLLARIPYAGWIVFLAALLVGFGALLLQLKRALRT